MDWEIVSEVKVLDLGGGAVATELVGFLHGEQHFTSEPWPWQHCVVQITLPCSMMIITYPLLQEKESGAQPEQSGKEV